MFVISVQPGREVIDAVTTDLQARGVTSGAIVSIIGAADAVCISNMPKGDALDDILTEYEQPMEMSGTGEVKDGIPHIHAVLGAEGDIALSGHLHWARVKTHFVNVYILPLG